MYRGHAFRLIRPSPFGRAAPTGTIPTCAFAFLTARGLSGPDTDYFHRNDVPEHERAASSMRRQTAGMARHSFFAQVHLDHDRVVQRERYPETCVSEGDARHPQNVPAVACMGQFCSVVSLVPSACHSAPTSMCCRGSATAMLHRAEFSISPLSEAASMLCRVHCR